MNATIPSGPVSLNVAYFIFQGMNLVLPLNVLLVCSNIFKHVKTSDISSLLVRSSVHALFFPMLLATLTTATLYVAGFSFKTVDYFFALGNCSGFVALFIFLIIYRSCQKNILLFVGFFVCFLALGSFVGFGYPLMVECSGEVYAYALFMGNSLASIILLPIKMGLILSFAKSNRSPLVQTLLESTVTLAIAITISIIAAILHFYGVNRGYWKFDIATKNSSLQNIPKYFSDLETSINLVTYSGSIFLTYLSIPKIVLGISPLFSLDNFILRLVTRKKRSKRCTSQNNMEKDQRSVYEDLFEQLAFFLHAIGDVIGVVIGKQPFFYSGQVVRYVPFILMVRCILFVLYVLKTYGILGYSLHSKRTQKDTKGNLMRLGQTDNDNDVVQGEAGENTKLHITSEANGTAEETMVSRAPVHSAQKVLEDIFYLCSILIFGIGAGLADTSSYQAVIAKHSEAGDFVILLGYFAMVVGSLCGLFLLPIPGQYSIWTHCCKKERRGLHQRQPSQ